MAHLPIYQIARISGRVLGPSYVSLELATQCPWTITMPSHENRKDRPADWKRLREQNVLLAVSVTHLTGMLTPR